jgi:hypothetical protein
MVIFHSYVSLPEGTGFFKVDGGFVFTRYPKKRAIAGWLARAGGCFLLLLVAAFFVESSVWGEKILRFSRFF